ncbi:UvrD-helicase domain-containing protein [Paenibacillus sp. N1-5-1-14]|uniref:UvrD-helicase domain-containing protein n=1 Tax=Paenibacillus radicibacter TaxID=2972488 RepID=UPI002158AEA5|nr:UvrD-helicase domain-containing protein [Paenibacillus radicibacter]MCR8644194.1 UvrD-helicase domain-containing protein [Paenibacillus radicibacter]
MTAMIPILTRPEGSMKDSIPHANIASTFTSIDLVPDQDSDAFYFRSLEKRNIKLNELQIAAVRHVGGAALIVAGAGSGKTSVLTSRAGYLIAMGHVQPHNLLLVTFTSKAAEEMKQRISLLPGLTVRMAREVVTGTFHSIFYRILRSEGFDQKIMSSENHRQTIIKIILRKMNLHDAYEPETLLSLLSSYKSNMMSIDDLPNKSPAEKEQREVFRQYEAWKRDNHYMDFDDMLLEAYMLLQRSPNMLWKLQERFQYVMVDEWQDTNPIQYELIKMLTGNRQNLFVVGDDDQTIFTFNGADSSIILNFDQVFPKAKVILLDVNYRSTNSIVGLGNEVIRFNQMRRLKTLQATRSGEHHPYFLRPSTTDDEAMMVVSKIKHEVQAGRRNYRDFAILHRTISSSRAMFEQLVMDGVPFMSFSMGVSFYEQSIVRPVIDYLRLSLNPKLQSAMEGIIPSLYLNREKSLTFIYTHELKEPLEKPLQHLLKLPDLKSFQLQQLGERLRMVDKLKDMKPQLAIQEIRRTYDAFLDANERQQLTLHKEMVKETLSEIEASAKRFDKVAEYVDFIDHVIQKNSEMEQLRKDPTSDALSLLTIHKAKGLEFPVVYVIGASESILPHSSALDADGRKDMISDKKGPEKVAAAIEEERRLAYVAVTRAMQEVYISSPSYYRGDQVEVSRFFMEPYGNKKKDPAAKQQSAQKEETFPTWECTKTGCRGWMRITSVKHAPKEKVCPLCNEKMKRSKRTVVV